MKKPPVFLALDLDSRSRALDLAKKAKDHVMGYKIGPRLFLAYGPKLVREVKSLSGAKIFLDFKFYDIPSSVLAGVKAGFEIGADFLTVHAEAGRGALELLSQYEKEARRKRFFQILCVTVLSSRPNSKKNQERVGELADLAYQSGLRGLVCSPWEARALRQKFPDMFLVTPGIRLKGDSLGDQKRVMTPERALKEGSSALVMGRSLIEAKDPLKLLQDISAALG